MAERPRGGGRPRPASLPEIPASGGSEEPRSNPEAEAEKPAVDNRWWVDMGSPKRKPAARAEAPVTDAETPAFVVGERLFGVGRGFDQDRAKAHLSGSNRSWLEEGNPPENGWAVIKLTDDRPRDDLVGRVKQGIRLPAGARGVLLDSGSIVRAIVTGTPVGQRICEVSIGADSSFDAFVGEEWVFERVWRGRDRALRESSGLVARWLAAED